MWGTGLIAAAALAAASNDAPSDGLVVDLRYRNAHIDQVGFEKPAEANTLRVTLGYKWTFAPDWSLYAEGTRVVGLFGDRYNSGANGATDRPAEGDPTSSEISAAWLGYDDKMAHVRVGRQYVNLDNQRFFTSGLWRQNPQSFDALDASWRFDSGTTLRYLHLARALRSVGHDYPDAAQREWSLDANLVHVDQKLPLGTLSGYGYFVENRTQPKNSWRTAGVRWTGNAPIASSTIAWTAEGARQSTWRNNPASYTADYRLLEASYGVSAITMKLGDETLGGDGRTAFSSPYGSNHAFNGWTSQFKSVPPNGLDDRYATLSGKAALRLGWAVTYHAFFADRIAAHYGHEINALASYAIRGDLSLEVDYATYRRDAFGTNERALWTILEYRHGAIGG